METAMNELFTQLANEAQIGLFEDKSFGWSVIAGTDRHLEKFAESIVRECGVALSPMLRDMVSRGQAYDLIKKHFGVEE
jgi:hypothetical protein